VTLPDGKYFSPVEMACRDGTPYPEQWVFRLGVLFQAFDTIREAHGGPISIVSGYRSDAHNVAIGGAEKSQHPEGRAGDLRPVGAKNATDIHNFHRLIVRLLGEGKLPAVGGIGCYPWTKRNGALVPGWCHVDTRPRPASGHIARWEGKQFGDEQAIG
jgi:uncharacterized protein YcbK (DUF882 family)